MNSLLRKFAAVACAVVAASWSAAKDVTPPVEVDAGLISGVTLPDGVRVYKGIPFAAPPVANLRWRAPKPVRPWAGVRECVEFGLACPQPKTPLNAEIVDQDEDCLYLNIWTGAKPGDKLPVMVWIHGGGCATGAGSMLVYNGAQLARHGVVAVTINYRLNIFGFFAHPLLSRESPQGVSGNYGFLDQIAALQWVQQNIAAFGGDPNCVTIFGESAGSASVARLMVSPLAKGLFHRAIAESGGAIGRNRHLREWWNGMEPMEQIGTELVARLGYEKSPDPLAALRAMPAAKLLKESQATLTLLFAKGIAYSWVIDGWALPDDPVALWASGAISKVPFMAGSNANEGMIFLETIPIKHAVGYGLTLRMAYGANAEEASKFFPIDDDEVAPALDRWITVAGFAQPARAMVRAVEASGAPSFLYQFTRVPEQARTKHLGAFHGLELPYVFGNLPPRRSFQGTDSGLSDVMIRYWTNFAKTGNPNAPGLPDWPAYKTETDSNIELGDAVKLVPNLFKPQCDFLDKVTQQRLENRKAKGPQAGDAGL